MNPAAPGSTDRGRDIGLPAKRLVQDDLRVGVSGELFEVLGLVGAAAEYEIPEVLVQRAVQERDHCRLGQDAAPQGKATQPLEPTEVMEVLELPFVRLETTRAGHRLSRLPIYMVEDEHLGVREISGSLPKEDDMLRSISIQRIIRTKLKDIVITSAYRQIDP